MFRLADIQFDVLRFSVLSDDHAGVNLLARSDEEGSALLCGVKTVGDRLACLKRNQGTLLTVSDIAFIRCIIFELCIDDTRTFGGGHELSAETDQAAGRNLKFQAGGTVTCAAHTVQLAFSFAEQLDDCAGKFIRNVHISNFHRLQLSAALVFLVNNLCLADCKFITLTAHVLDQYGQMQLTAAGYLEAVCGIRFLHAKGNVCVQLAHQTVTDMTGGHILAFLSRQRAVVYHEVHGDRRFGDFLKRNSFRVIQVTAEGIADMDVCDSGYSDNGADGGFSHLDFFQTVELVELADLYFFPLGQIVMVHQHDILIDTDRSVVHLADTDTADIFIVINGADQYLSACVGISLRSRDIFQDCLEQRSHILRRIVQIQDRMAKFCGCVQERAVQLLVGSVQIHQKFQHLIDHLIRTRFRAVDLIDADDDGQIHLKRLFQHKFGLRHCALKSIHHKDDAVHHFQHTFHLAAEVGMAGSVDDIDLYAVIINSGIFGKNRDSTFPLDIVGVHDTLLNFLVGAEHTALL